MDDLNKLSSFKFDKDQKNIIIDLLLSDIFNRHGINEEKLKNLSPEKKQQIKSIVSEIQSQVNNYLDWKGVNIWTKNVIQMKIKSGVH